MEILFWIVWILIGAFNCHYLLPYMERKEIYSDIPGPTYAMNFINGPIGTVIQIIVIILFNVFKLIRKEK
jgi:hypothetical protein